MHRIDSAMQEESTRVRVMWDSLSEHLEDLDRAVDEFRCEQRRDRANASSSSLVQAQAVQRRLDHLYAFVNGVVEANDLHSPVRVLRELSPPPYQPPPQQGRVERELLPPPQLPRQQSQRQQAHAGIGAPSRQRRRGGRGQAAQGVPRQRWSNPFIDDPIEVLRGQGAYIPFDD